MAEAAVRAMGTYIGQKLDFKIMDMVLKCINMLSELRQSHTSVARATEHSQIL